MRASHRPLRFATPPSATRLALVPALSIAAASLLVLTPVVLSAPLLPPFGFALLLGWRLLRDDLLPPWAGLPLGLFDDLWSGQPLGSGVALFTAALLVMEAVDRRFLFRTRWEDWGLGAALLCGYCVGAAIFALLLGPVPTLPFLVPQMLVSALAFPMIMRVAAWLDGWRTGR